uniref:Uncharacterized protein n=1 Tax=Ixodes ricinus TaxID=34613 RepID=A0A6B0UGA3_IXORI
MNLNSTNLLLWLYFLFLEFSRILKLVLACACIAITLYLCRPSSTVLPRLPYKYTSAGCTRVQLVYQFFVKTAVYRGVRLRYQKIWYNLSGFMDALGPF